MNRQRALQASSHASRLEAEVLRTEAELSVVQRDLEANEDLPFTPMTLADVTAKLHYSTNSHANSSKLPQANLSTVQEEDSKYFHGRYNNKHRQTTSTIAVAASTTADPVFLGDNIFAHTAPLEPSSPTAASPTKSNSTVDPAHAALLHAMSPTGQIKKQHSLMQHLMELRSELSTIHA
jgi:hypothetical protein